MSSAVKTRFAPSPTGLLHVGGVRTALFNLLYARRSGGKFVLRIEDTDAVRSKPEFEKAICDDLVWLGLKWDEGPYRQSERLDIYREHAGRLLAEGMAYNCWCTTERLEQLREKQLKAGCAPKYDGKCSKLSPQDAPRGATPAIRFKIPSHAKRQVAFIDGVHGSLSFDIAGLGDFVIIGSDGVASYNFAAVVDDSAMNITHIIRGDDHISNTARQILLFEALKITPPMFAHIPLVLTPEKTPLSKRDLSASVSALRDDGFLPEAIIDAVARLGWAPDDGLLTVNDMAEGFGIERLSKSPSVFDMERLKHINKRLIEGQTAARLIELAGIKATPDNSAMLAKAIDAVKANAVTLSGLKTLLVPFTGHAALDSKALTAVTEPYAKGVLSAFLSALEKAERLDEKGYNEIMAEVKKTTGEKGARLFMPIRCALTGAHEGIELYKIIELLGREKTTERLKKWL